MASTVDRGMLKTSPPRVPMTDNATFNVNFSGYWQTVADNTSLHEDCISVIFSEMEYLPWDNPDNIVSAEVENTIRTIKNNVLGLLFLIGGPANVINMAVFYKQGLKDRVNLCLFALSFADGMYLAMAMLHHGEHLFLQFSTKERFGPVETFLANRQLSVFCYSFMYISQILSAVIAAERCLCVFNPLKVRSLLNTRTMLVFILLISALVFGLYFIVTFRYSIGCVYDPTTGTIVKTAIEGRFYKAHKEFINNLESSVFGAGLPGVSMITVTVMTIMTIVKLRQAMSWRSKTSSSLSPREVALTKVLVRNSIFFIVCSSPFALDQFVRIFFVEMNAGRRNQNFFLSLMWIDQTFSFINATFNIVFYYTMGSHFREIFWTLLNRNPQLKSRRSNKNRQKIENQRNWKHALNS